VDKNAPKALGYVRVSTELQAADGRRRLNAADSAQYIKLCYRDLHCEPQVKDDGVRCVGRCLAIGAFRQQPQADSNEVTRDGSGALCQDGSIEAHRASSSSSSP
jgi:hypothetical protein